MKKKVLSLLLSLAMVACMMPAMTFTAFAAKEYNGFYKNTRAASNSVETLDYELKTTDTVYFANGGPKEDQEAFTVYEFGSPKNTKIVDIDKGSGWKPSTSCKVKSWNKGEKGYIVVESSSTHTHGAWTYKNGGNDAKDMTKIVATCGETGCTTPNAYFNTLTVKADATAKGSIEWEKKAPADAHPEDPTVVYCKSTTDQAVVPTNDNWSNFGSVTSWTTGKYTAAVKLDDVYAYAAFDYLEPGFYVGTTKLAAQASIAKGNTVKYFNEKKESQAFKVIVEGGADKPNSQQWTPTDGNYEVVSVSSTPAIEIKVKKVNKLDLTVTAPVGRSLNATTRQQKLLSKLATSTYNNVAVGTVEYSLDDVNWSANEPVGMSVGKYTIKWRVVLTTDELKVYNQPQGGTVYTYISPKKDDAKYFDVTFKANNGSADEVVSIEEGTLVEKPADPTKEGFTFEGWFTDGACTAAYDFATPVVADTTLYAKWTAVEPTPEVQEDAITAPALTKTYKNKSGKLLLNHSFQIKDTAVSGRALTFKKLSGNKKITVSSTGKVTAKKGLKKGTYKVTVLESVGADDKWTAAEATKTITVKVAKKK